MKNQRPKCDRAFTVVELLVTTVHSPSEIRQKVVAPILFVDGHVSVCDFTATVKSQWPAEPTVNWVWYKPAH